MFPSLHSFCAGSFIFIAGIWDILQNTGQNVRVFLWERTVCTIDGLCIEQFGSGIVPSLDNVSSVCLCFSYVLHVCLFAIVDESRHFKKNRHLIESRHSPSVALLLWGSRQNGSFLFSGNCFSAKLLFCLFSVMLKVGQYCMRSGNEPKLWSL